MLKNRYLILLDKEKRRSNKDIMRKYLEMHKTKTSLKKGGKKKKTNKKRTNKNKSRKFRK